MLCYGSIFWGSKLRQIGIVTQLSHEQRLACFSSNEAMRTTPTVVMEAVLGFPPLDLYVKELALRMALRVHSRGL